MSPIETIAVIGAATLGRNIARDAVLAGYKVILDDLVRDRLDEAAKWLQKTGARSLTTTSVLEDAVREADLIIETAPKEMEIKIELFTIFDKFAKPGAILASATPALSIADMAEVTFCRERCIGMNFFHERPERNRIELIATPETSQSTIAACRAVAYRMNKVAVLIRETRTKDGASRQTKSVGG